MRVNCRVVRGYIVINNYGDHINMPQAGFEPWVIHINTCVNIVPSTLPLDHHGRVGEIGSVLVNLKYHVRWLGVSSL